MKQKICKNCGEIERYHIISKCEKFEVLLEKTGFNLSEKRKEVIKYFNKNYSYISPDKRDTIIEVLTIIEKQDKEFIKELKEEVKAGTLEYPFDVYKFLEKIDKIAGDELT